ncbi:hypothetical protein WJT74_06345 [Sphingomicrobium sp. XHP0239]|uniref:hypothetical protein n=1 Tax=Sphingomicrobium maritimum TaxID=3133972 RepID=UPI0031CCCD66
MMPIELPDDIDATFASFQEKERELEAALNKANSEQQEGRTGYASVLEAQKLSKDLQIMASGLLAKIDEAKAAIS